MFISVFELFTIGIGPSSSHSVGPMRAAGRFLGELRAQGQLSQVRRLLVELFGSLALTGIGHGTDKALLMGLEGETPEGIDPAEVPARVAAIHASHSLRMAGSCPLEFIPDRDLLFQRRKKMPLHSNGLKFAAFGESETLLLEREFYSIGGGFVVTPEECRQPPAQSVEVPYPFDSAAELLEWVAQTGLPISGLMLANEQKLAEETVIRERLDRIWQAMQNCVEQGCHAEGILPGGLKIRRRAPSLYEELSRRPTDGLRDPLTILDWVNLFAIAVNEQNAAGGRVVTAPTNGAAGIIPAVLHYYDRFTPRPDRDGVHRFLLTAGAIASLYKKNASISGAEVGCQGEVGVACSMAAGALTEVLGGTPAQVEQAAEIGMEHNLGLTCDPIGGLVQVPCIERNAMGAVKAINATRLALRSDGTHHVSLDRVIEVMRRTGADMSTKYKETSRGGLAVNLPEC